MRQKQPNNRQQVANSTQQAECSKQQAAPQRAFKQDATYMRGAGNKKQRAECNLSSTIAARKSTVIGMHPEDEGGGGSDGESDGEGSMAQLLAEEEQSNQWQSYFAN